jgi:putative Mn2+ efflux pump MntP
MGTLELIILGISLSIDSFVASVSIGANKIKLQFFPAMKIAFIMAFFQTLFPFLGWLTGKSIMRYIEEYDHWVAFIMLSAIGFKMIYDSLKNEETQKDLDLKNMAILGMAIATSIDALVVGIGFGIIAVEILLALCIIGFSTFLFSAVGIRIGKFIGDRFNKAAGVLGGLVLFLLGLKLLIYHA